MGSRPPGSWPKATFLRIGRAVLTDPDARGTAHFPRFSLSGLLVFPPNELSFSRPLNHFPFPSPAKPSPSPLSSARKGKLLGQEALQQIIVLGSSPSAHRFQKPVFTVRGSKLGIDSSALRSTELRMSSRDWCRLRSHDGLTSSSSDGRKSNQSKLWRSGLSTRR